MASMRERRADARRRLDVWLAAADPTNSGWLPSSELQALLKKHLNLHVSAHELKAMLASVGSTADGRVSTESLASHLVEEFHQKTHHARLAAWLKRMWLKARPRPRPDLRSRRARACSAASPAQIVRCAPR